eukprot:767440-Hanusia_phi.AAC.5
MNSPDLIRRCGTGGVGRVTDRTEERVEERLTLKVVELEILRAKVRTYYCPTRAAGHRKEKKDLPARAGESQAARMQSRSACAGRA